jgi:protein-disulfide isomerase
MASRTKQKEEARARRLAEERARAAQNQRQRRMRLLGGIGLIAIVIVAVAIAISSSGGSSGSSASLGTPAAKQSAAAVTSELSGIPQSGNRLGSPSAKVTITEWGDLECPICRDFAAAAGNQLIANDVKSGKVQLVYRSLETATGGAPDGATIFPVQQAAAIAAGQQGKAWDYILTFYKLQGSEGTSYVNTAFLNGIAKLIPGLNFAQWSSARTSPNLTSQITADAAAASSKGFNSTPTLVVQGPKGQGQPIVGNVGYSAIESAIKSVS